MKEIDCPCCSGKSYAQCCAPLHEGGYADSCLSLMRSRYSAYALGKVAYIIRTTHPANPNYTKNHKKWTKDLLHFCQTTTFEKLEILESTPNTVTFVAHLRQNGEIHLMQEKSYFLKEGAQWLYLSGQLT